MESKHLTLILRLIFCKVEAVNVFNAETRKIFLEIVHGKKYICFMNSSPLTVLVFLCLALFPKLKYASELCVQTQFRA